MAERKSSKTWIEHIPDVVGWFDTARERLSAHGEALLASWFAHIERGVHLMVDGVLKRIALFFFMLLGATFLLVGLARVLSTVYELPGIGDIIVGAFIFALVLLFSMIETRVKK
ncbi:MAG: hypothetical protein KBA91_01435 [Candidatus Moranbacteria bacterium]|jgi:hypothetical protein|nr:hypothetical protein [Candidatus Moranbacteria bacterium]